MRKSIFVRPLSDAERQALEAGLRSPDAFVLRRCQILLASARDETSHRIARSLGCHDQTVRNAVKRFNEREKRECNEWLAYRCASRWASSLYHHRCILR